MIIYIIPMIMCLIFNILGLKDKKAKIAYWIVVILLYLISAIRYNVGVDYIHWIDEYNLIEENLPGRLC